MNVGDKVALSEWLNLLILIARDTKLCTAVITLAFQAKLSSTEIAMCLSVLDQNSHQGST